MCKLPEDIYSMLLICEAQDVVEAPLPLNPEENEVWVRGSCTWKVKARILDVASTDQCKDVLSKKHQQKTTSATTKESSVSQTLVPNGQPVLASLESLRQKWNHSLFSVKF
jgi:hypothetical protein